MEEEKKSTIWNEGEQETAREARRQRVCDGSGGEYGGDCKITGNGGNDKITFESGWIGEADIMIGSGLTEVVRREWWLMRWLKN